jgi:putative ABC transport system substrate-binding protein
MVMLSRTTAVMICVKLTVVVGIAESSLFKQGCCLPSRAGLDAQLRGLYFCRAPPVWLGGLMPNRRAFLYGILLALTAPPRTAQAQHAGTPHRVGLVFTTAPVAEMAGPDPVHPFPRAFLRALAALGYTQGRNLTYLPRSAEGRFERIGTIVQDLVDSKVDVIVAPGDEIPLRAKALTKTIPIVMMSFSDPIELGLVASFARPGGNVTGISRTTSPEIEGKRMQLLKEAFPTIRRAAYLGTKQDWASTFGLSVRSAARDLGVTLLPAELDPADYTGAFARIVRERPEVLFAAQNTSNFAHRKRIAEFAFQNRLPSIYHTHEFVHAGGLMSYGADLTDLYRHAASFVDKILKGARPGDLPVEYPRKFELVVNMKTARDLGLTLPPSLLLRADRVVD